MIDPETNKRINSLVQQLGDLERKVAFLLAHSAVPYVDTRAPLDAIQQLIMEGNRLQAIKSYQAQHGVGLAEAKRVVEEMAARLGV